MQIADFGLVLLISLLQALQLVMGQNFVTLLRIFVLLDGHIFIQVQSLILLYLDLCSLKLQGEEINFLI